MNQQSLELLEDLTKKIGISGDEKQVSRFLNEKYKGLCDEIVYDNLGSIFAVKKCGKENALRVMLCAHMDEVGFMITEIHENGLLSFIKIGNIENTALYASRVKVKTAQNEFIGTIVANEEAISKPGVKGLRIDLGATTKEEVVNMGVCVGDSAVLDGDFILMNNKRMLAKAIDSRSGCALGVELLEAVKDNTFDFDLYVGASVMEEVGQRGGTTATGMIHPDMGIVLDGGKANDFNGKNNDVGQLGKGVLVRYYDKGMMPNRGLLDELVTTCKDHKISYQYYYSMATTDSAWVHKLFSGCPTLTIGVCARNIQTGNVEIDCDDYTCAKEALVHIVKGLNAEKIQEYKEFNR